MSGLDVEELLDEAARAASPPEPISRGQSPPEPIEDRYHKSNRSYDERRDRDEDRKRRDRSRDRSRRERDHDGDEDMSSTRAERGGRSREKNHSDDRDSRRDRHSDDRDDTRGGDFYRGPGRPRTRSRSPRGDNHYRPSDRRRERGDHPRERYRDHNDRRGDRRSPKDHRPPTPQLTEDERDRRTVFVQQLAARLRTKELIAFFEKVGEVKEAQIVKDRVSGRSKGVGYVEFKEEESVPGAIQLTGQKLLGIPIIAQLTEAEKNRQARSGEGAVQQPGVPFHRLYVGNIHFSITEEDLQNVFDPFGELELVQLMKDDSGRSRGYGFVQFKDPAEAKDALEKMNGFDLAGRPIRVGLGNDKFTAESTRKMLEGFPAPGQTGFQGSSFSGAGGRGTHAGGNDRFGQDRYDRYDREDRGHGHKSGNASALDDTDVGVAFNNITREKLMQNLANRGGVQNPTMKQAPAPVQKKPLPIDVGQASRCVLLKNMFDPLEEEQASGPKWMEELEQEIKEEAERKYGAVVHIAIDPNTAGDIYVKFAKLEGGDAAMKGLNGRFFNKRMITAQPVVDAVYTSLFGRTRAL